MRRNAKATPTRSRAVISQVYSYLAAHGRAESKKKKEILFFPKV